MVLRTSDTDAMTLKSKLMFIFSFDCGVRCHRDCPCVGGSGESGKMTLILSCFIHSFSLLRTSLSGAVSKTCCPFAASSDVWNPMKASGVGVQLGLDIVTVRLAAALAPLTAIR